MSSILVVARKEGHPHFFCVQNKNTSKFLHFCFSALASFLLSLSRACVCVRRAARWVFNLSKHNNVVDSGPPPDTITSTIDKKRPGLGGLVWINAVLGNLHCCLQKGVKNKAVTPVPTDTLDGWLNGQTGFWWIGALKEGHRALWDSHVVMNWAMVFIPSSPEVRLGVFLSLSVRRCVRV